MKKILGEAVAAGNAASRTLRVAPRDPSWFYYPGSAWTNFLFQSGYEFETPIPPITAQGAKPLPPTGYRQLDARSAFFYGVTGITPAMAMRLPGNGSQYLLAFQDADKQFFDGGKTYRLMLPKGIPFANFWSLTLYDNQTRSMLATPQNYPRAAAARATPRPRRRTLPTTRPRWTSARSRRPACRAAIGSRPCRARAGSRSCACTARWNHSSQSRGGRARSNSSGRPANHGSHEDRSDGGAAENLDWLNSDSQASAVGGGAEAAERDLDPRLVVPADVGVQGCNERIDGRG